METEIQLLGRMGLVLVLGFIIGIERGWSFQQKKEGQRTAGIRTFTLIALSGGIWGILSEHVGAILLGAALVGFVLIIMVGYYQYVRQTGLLGLTTEMAAFVTFGIGVAVIKGYIILSVAVTVVMVLLLSIKPRLHTWVKTIEPQEFYSGILFLAISAVVLPLLPNRGYGPWGALNPFEIWGMVVLIAGISYMGYFSMKYLGSDKGILFTSCAGSLVSSIAVTVTLGRIARDGGTTDMVVIGALIANFTALVHMLLWVGIFNPALIYGVGPSVVLMIVATSGLALWVWLNGEYPKKQKQFSSIRNPLQLSTAIPFGLILALVMLLSEGSKQWLGDPGVYGLSIISGMVDMDAIALSLLQMGGTTLSAEAAANGLILVAISNTFIKGAIFAFYSGVKNALKPLIFFLLIMLASIPGLLLS
ncbi:MgtC/SapB family protein [Fodinibius sediminis]|uniref:Uncharacterized membrane protein, DUF4010 family n=1 Tax=Fodinibius sediminis TaxID=1214077 RepID=A0A521CID9_9BACT|nr:MgtC/SapB family protein [Fodinibius sediminis]SMO58460.1 Uncharacterized membrane protein, DUF4010 family [Fodinibius sediminis]